ncbi:MAG: NAD-dependent epimerase/dehydratase family protein, partial [Gammaproteobacteria bacterium]
MILVVGARGCLGSAVSRRLLARRLSVRVASRRPDNLADLLACGAEPMCVDLRRPETLAIACEGVDTVFAAAHGLLGRGANRSEAVDLDGHRALIDAACAAGVRRFVYTSVLGAAPDHPVDFWRSKFAVERHLEASGLAFTILRPSAFMDIHAHRLIGRAVL